MLAQEKLSQVRAPENFQELFQTYYPVVCRQVAYLLGATEAVEDIAQETFLKLYYSPPGELTNPGGWLGRVAANLSYNYLKSEKSRKAREVNSRSPLAVHNLVNIEDLILKNQEVVQVRNILNQLTERDRMVLLLKFSGYSYREIGEIIGLEKSSVGTILARAQSRFKTLYLQQEGRGPHVL